MDGGTGGLVAVSAGAGGVVAATMPSFVGSVAGGRYGTGVDADRWWRIDASFATSGRGPAKPLR